MEKFKPVNKEHPSSVEDFNPASHPARVINDVA